MIEKRRNDDLNGISNKLTTTSKEIKDYKEECDIGKDFHIRTKNEISKLVKQFEDAISSDGKMHIGLFDTVEKNKNEIDQSVEKLQNQIKAQSQRINELCKESTGFSKQTSELKYDFDMKIQESNKRLEDYDLNLPIKLGKLDNFPILKNKFEINEKKINELNKIQKECFSKISLMEMREDQMIKKACKELDESFKKYVNDKLKELNSDLYDKLTDIIRTQIDEGKEDNIKLIKENKDELFNEIESTRKLIYNSVVTTKNLAFCEQYNISSKTSVSQEKKDKGIQISPSYTIDLEKDPIQIVNEKISQMKSEILNKIDNLNISFDKLSALTDKEFEHAKEQLKDLETRFKNAEEQNQKDHNILVQNTNDNTNLKKEFLEIEEDIRKMNNLESNFFASELNQKISQESTNRKKLKTDLMLEIKKLTTEIALIAQSSSESKISLIEVTDVIIYLIQDLKIELAMELCDEKDRELISLIGVKGSSEIMKDYKSNQSILNINNRCITCTNDQKHLISLFKIACLSYHPSKINVDQVLISRKDLIKKRMDTFKKIIQKYNFVKDFLKERNDKLNDLFNFENFENFEKTRNESIDMNSTYAFRYANRFNLTFYKSNDNFNNFSKKKTPLQDLQNSKSFSNYIPSKSSRFTLLNATKSRILETKSQGRRSNFNLLSKDK